MSVDDNWGEVLRKSGVRLNPNDNTDFNNAQTVTLVAKALELNKAINLVSFNTRELW